MIITLSHTLSAYEEEASSLSQKMWDLASPFLSEQDISVFGAYRDGDEWELLINFMAMVCADENVPMPFAVRKFLTEVSWDHWQKILEFAVLDEPQGRRSMSDDEFQRLMGTLANDLDYSE